MALSGIDLRPDLAEIVKQILAEHVPECEVRAFGSRATWTAMEYSDLDLVVVGDGPLDWRTMGRLKEAFEESRLPVRVDVLDWHSILDGFKAKIEGSQVVIQKPTRSKIWPTTQLGQVVDLRLSNVDKKSKTNEEPVLLCNYTDIYKNDFIHAGIDFMMATATKREILKCSLKRLDVVITKDSEAYDDIGVPALIREDISQLVCGYHLAILRPLPSELDGNFLFYVLRIREVRHQFSSFANGVTRFGLRKADIGLVQIPYPSLTKQRGIANILRTLDDKIELNRRMCRTLEEMAQALFKSWFVDFDPVRAKMEGRWRPGESLPGLPAHLYDLFPDRLVDSELGPIPEGWAVQSLDQIADFTNGLAMQRFPPDSDEWLPVIKIAEMRRGYTTKTGKASRSIAPRYVIEDGDVLFSWSGSLELVMWSHGPGALNQHLFKVTSDQYPRWFYWGWTHEHLNDFREIAAGKATTMGHIRRQHLTEANVAVPPAEILKAGDTPLAALLRQQVAYAVQNRTLATLRDELLPKLVSGELRIPVAETATE